ncbi:MAG: ferrous iron transport protein A [Ignavibacteriae bacterium]|nr:ferrous iron transport protein A [Ignavibacteriota bacterium]
MRLSEAPLNVELRISEIKTNKEMKRKLNTLGIQTDELLLKIYDAKWGPILVRPLSNGNSKIALDRNVAKSIKVKDEN